MISSAIWDKSARVNYSKADIYTLNLIGFGVCDLGEPIRCHSSLPVSLIDT